MDLELIQIFFVVFLSILGLLILFAIFFEWPTIREFEQGVLFRNGRYVKTLGPGKHIFWRFSHALHRIDTRPSMMVIPGQDIPTADGIIVKVSMIVRYAVINPKAAFLNSESYRDTIYTYVQIAARSAVGAWEIDELFQKRDEINDAIMAKCASELEFFGVKLQMASVRDFSMPADLRRIFSQVVHSRKEGLANLERARGETAAIRNLANSAKLLEDHPVLLQIELLQAIRESSNNTFVLAPHGQPQLPVNKGTTVKSD
jgi:regulator of protease activity HflC (stomatin/prohibitin superfamily)